MAYYHGNTCFAGSTFAPTGVNTTKLYVVNRHLCRHPSSTRSACSSSFSSRQTVADERLTYVLLTTNVPSYSNYLQIWRHVTRQLVQQNNIVNNNGYTGFLKQATCSQGILGQAMTKYGGSRPITPHMLTFGTRRRWEVGSPLGSLIPGNKSLRWPTEQKPRWPQIRSARFEKRKNMSFWNQTTFPRCSWIRAS